MKRQTEALWNMAVALIGLGGGTTLIENFFPTSKQCIGYGIGSIFAIGFVIAVYAFILQSWEIGHPLKITCTLDINTQDSERALVGGKVYPILELDIGFYSAALVHIKKQIILKLPDDILKDLKVLVSRFRDDFQLEINDDKNFITIQEGGSIQIKAQKDLKLKTFNNEMDAKLEDIYDKLVEYKIGWEYFNSNKIHWYKVKIHYRRKLGLWKLLLQNLRRHLGKMK